MNQPPDDQPGDGPTGDLPDGGGLSLDEPPQPREGTRPLKPLPRLKGKPRDQGASAEPPGTVLHEAPPTAPDQPDLPWTPGVDTDRVRLVPHVPDPPPWRVIFQTIKPTVATIGVDVRQPLVIGRVDPDGGESGDLDLTAHQAIDQGVSRRHALLIPAPDGLYLSDLGSTNGTWVNGSYLEPGLRYALQTGDRVELGLMRLIVKSVGPLARSSGG
jgi:hypothetical protein